MNNYESVLKQIKPILENDLSYEEMEELANYFLEKSEKKRNSYFEEKYNRLLVLKKDLLVDEKYTKCINLYKLLKGINSNSIFFENDFFEMEKSEKEEYKLLKKELEKEIEYLNNNNQKEKADRYLEAITIPKKVKTTKISIDNIKIGSIIEFGNYPYDKKRSIAPIKWKVLDIKNNKALLLTDEAIDCKQFHEQCLSYTSWERSTLRKWLNSNFYNKAFSEEEKKYIEVTDVIAYKNPKYETYQGINTKDWVFLLSIQEAERYFKNNEERTCAVTEYAVKNGVCRFITNRKETSYWWLRSPGSSSHYASGVFSDGTLSYSGDFVDNSYRAVRPALWINLNSIMS